MSEFGAMCAMVAAVWIFCMMLNGVRLNDDCRYFVPVKNHPGIYACSNAPKPVKP